MKRYSQASIDLAKKRLLFIKPSHNEAHLIKEGWQMGMYEKEITNYDGFGCIMRVVGKTTEEAEALALIICRKLNTGEDTEGGTYDGCHTFN